MRPLPAAVAEAVLARVERCRSADGGYATSPDAATGSAYAAFLAVGAYQDLGRALPALQNASLKGLLRRVIGKVFRVEIKGWCSEFETRNAAGRQAGAQAAG